MMNRRLTYWWCQGGGWLLYTVVGLAIGFAFQPVSWRYAMTVFLNTGTGLALTHAWRAQIRLHGWMQRSWWALAPRLLGSGLLLATLWTALSVLMSYGLFGQQPESAVVLAIWFNWNMTLLIWALLYSGWHLVERYQQAEVQKWRLEAVIKDAELSALKAQLNPHFLFNALNSIRALIVENPARGQTAVTQLANILRYSLHASAAATISLRDELQFVHDYLALEKIRFDERLTVQTQCDDAALAYVVPPMIVQTLVENAIKHGIATRRQGGVVAVRAWVETAQFRIQVRNQGRLNQNLASPRLGLQNATERLQLLFGAQAVLTLTDNDDDWVIADLTLPLQPTDNQ